MTDEERWAGQLAVAPRPTIAPLAMASLSPASPMLVDRVVMISGGSSGVGRSLVELCLQHGAHVATMARRPCPDSHANLSSHIGDVTRADDRLRWFAHALGRWRRIDMLVNNAARADGTLAEQLAVNAIACDELIRMVVDPMRAAGGGRIINITSDLSMVPAPLPLAPYAASKAALNSLTRSWAAALHRTGILVNALHPGHVRTRLAPSAPNPPELVWPMFLALATSASDGPTGRVFGPDGELRWS